MRTAYYYEDHLLYVVDGKGKLHHPKKRAGSSSTGRCPDCDYRDALTQVGLPKYCSECRQNRNRGKRRCTFEGCANGCEVCGGTGRAPS